MTGLRYLLGAAAALVATAPMTPSPAIASPEWGVRGGMTLELRSFPMTPLYEGQARAALSPSLSIAPELSVSWDHGADVIVITPLLRADWDDDARSHADLRAFHWTHLGDGWTLQLGVGKVFWGVTESRHLVDIVNQDDRVEDLDGEQKLGQPLINLSIDLDGGTFELFLLPGFRERTFADARARLSGPLAIDEDARYASSLGRWYPSAALRWSHAFGTVDLGLSHFHGTSREPTFDLEPSDAGPYLRPRYGVIDQTGLELQWTHDAWLFKLEAIGRGGHGYTFAAAVAGFEVTLYQLFGGNSDLGILIEGLWDGRSDDPAVTPATLFDHDAFVGFRWASNDTRGTQLLAGAVTDLTHGETIVSVEASQRLGESWLAELEATWPLWTDEESPAHHIRRDGHVTMRLTRYL